MKFTSDSVRDEFYQVDTLAQLLFVKLEIILNKIDRAVVLDSISPDKKRLKFHTDPFIKPFEASSLARDFNRIFSRKDKSLTLTFWPNDDIFILYTTTEGDLSDRQEMRQHI